MTNSIGSRSARWIKEKNRLSGNDTGERLSIGDPSIGAENIKDASQLVSRCFKKTEATRRWPLKPSRFAGAAELLLFFLLSALASQLTSLRAPLPASRPPTGTSFHATGAPLLTPLRASRRGRRGGLLRLGLSI